MANKVTGSTDTSGSLSISPSLPKSLLIVGTPNEGVVSIHEPNTVFPIVSTKDVKKIFGEDSPMVSAAKILISNGVDNINGMIIGKKEQKPDDTVATPDPPTPPQTKTVYSMAFTEKDGYNLRVSKYGVDTVVTEANFESIFDINEDTGDISLASAYTDYTLSIVDETDTTSVTATTIDDLKTNGWITVTSDEVEITVEGGDPVAYITEDEEEEETVEYTDFEEALIASMDDVTIKVILTDRQDEDSIVSLKAHLALCEKNDMFRYAVIAPPADCTTKAQLVTFARGINCDRIFIPGPIMVDSDGKIADRVSASAGLSAVIMTETSDPALPLDSVKIKGLGGVTRRALDEEKKYLAENGITPLYSDGDTPVIWRLVTSCIDDKVWQEGTTRFISDYVLETVENTLRANYKRTKNVARILGDTGIRGTVKMVLNTMQDREIIENFDETTLTVIKDPDDMYGALVDYEIDVVTPLYTITITQHLKL